MDEKIELRIQEPSINKTGVKKTKAGFKATTYKLTTRAYLAILLNSTNLNKLVTRADEATASVILAAATYTT